MSRRVTRKLAGAAGAALVILVPAPAFAGPGSGGGGGSGGSVDGVLTAHVTYQTNGGSGGDGCSWERIVSKITDAVLPELRAGPPRAFRTVGVVASCSEDVVMAQRQKYSLEFRGHRSPAR